MTFSAAYLEKGVCSLSINSICINSNNRCKFKKQTNFEREFALLSLVYFFFSENGCVPAVLLGVSTGSCVFCVLC